MVSVNQPVVADTEILGVSAPLRGFIYLTLFSGSPRRLCLTKPLIIGWSPAIVGYRSWNGQWLPLIRRSARFAMGGFVPLNRSWTRLHPSPGIWRMRSGRLRGRVAPLHHSLGFRHLPSDLLLLRLASQVLRIQKATLHPLVHLGDGPTTPLRVRLGILLARGVILLPARGVGSRTIRLPMRVNRPQLADNGTISRMTRTIFVLLPWLFCWITSSESFQPPPNPWSSLPPNDFTSLRLRVWWTSRLSGLPISPGLGICEQPAIRPRRSLSLRSWRAGRYPHFCPRSQGPRGYLPCLAKGRLSR